MYFSPNRSPFSLSSDIYNGDTRLPHPHERSDTNDPRDRAVAVKFTRSGQNLIVTYLSHGIVCVHGRSCPSGILTSTADAMIYARVILSGIFPPLRAIQQCEFTTSFSAVTLFNGTSSGYSAVSPDYRSIVTHNFKNGLHEYSLVGSHLSERAKPQKSYRFDVPPQPRIALQIAFVHYGSALVSGTSTGNVCIWETATGDYFQQLDHDGGSVSLCISGNPLTCAASR